MTDVMEKVQEIDEKVRHYEDKLRGDLGMGHQRVGHFARPRERTWTKDQIASTTVLFGGLSTAHDELVADAMRGRGYNMTPLPCPDNYALEVGKEYGNRGQCNPTYYTVGNLVRYLRQLKAQGEKDIEDRYVFVTAGSCGPCRFGMYEAEYRQVLEDAGFGGFRVILFQQSGGFSQSDPDSALEFNAGFALAFLKALMLGDMVNELGYKIRPYEVTAGETDQAIAEAKLILGETLRERRSVIRALGRVRKVFSTISVDRTRLKPRVKITGEIWAQTTEGDGNYHMFRWLESEGAEVITEPVCTWVEYKIWIARHRAHEKRRVNKGKRSTIWQLKVAQWVYRGWHNLYRMRLGFRIEVLPSQQKLADYASKYFNTYIGGGEGHLEIGKNIMTTKEKHAHMVLSLKPFGCMPSTMSDGVQSRVVSDYKDSIFLPIETSGDGENSVKSRVQMKLYEAKMMARQELADVLDAHKVTIEQVREYVARHPKYGNAMRRPSGHRAIGSAANLVAEVAGRIK